MANQIPPKPPRGQSPLPNRLGRPLMGWALVLGAIAMFAYLLSQGVGQRRQIDPIAFWRYLQNGDIVGTIAVHEDEIEGTLSKAAPGLQQGDRLDFTVKYPALDRGQDFAERMEKAIGGQNVRYVFEPSSWWHSLIGNVLVFFLVLGAVWFLLFRRLGAAAGGAGFLGSFGRSRHRLMTKEHTNVTFNDVAGVQEAKDEVSEVVEFLKNPRKFQRLGGRIPRGVLLVGEPGCGKTLLAKAIAGEADVPFFLISGSDFVEMFVGVGASRVRDLFKQAKDSAPCIIFLDEIDAVGRRRGVGFNGGGHDEREQTLNAILVEMDGFDSSDQVIVIAATNRVDVLDPALTRPGRFDRQIQVPLPDLKGRFEILKIYAAKVKCGPDVDLHRLARGTPMFSGADLAALVNEAAIQATMTEKDFVEQEDMEEARDKVRWGRARKSRVVDERERTVTAFHEAGHALVQALMPDADPLHKVSIIPRGAMGGATFSLPERDRYLYTRNYCNAVLCVCFGGRLSEEIFCNDISSGAQSDIAQATDLARHMVLDWGMSERVGPINYHSGDSRAAMMEPYTKEYSDRTAEVIDSEIRALIDKAYDRTRHLLEEHRDQLNALANALLKYETLNADEVRQILDGKSLDKPTVSDLLEAEANKPAPPAKPAPSRPETQPGVGPLPQPG